MKLTCFDVYEFIKKTNLALLIYTLDMKTLQTLTIVLLTTNSFSQSMYFPPASGNTWDTLSPQSLGWCQQKIDAMYDYLENNNSKAFILLKDGKIVLEKYFGSFDQNSTWYWASAGKTITSFMTGIAQQEGHLSITDTTAHYLGQGWTDCTSEQEEKITVRHQLTMTSGLDDGVPDNFCTLDTCLIYKANAGDRWAYHNGPYTLLDGVIENATGVSLNSYTTQKLKNPTGMTGMFYSVDYNNVFFSTARSMARFGLLILNQGNWNGNQLMTDQAYFDQMVTPSQSINNSYGYLWWLNGQSSFMMPGTQIVFPGSLTPAAPADMIAALGMNGQFIDIIPSENIVWIRMGEAPNGGLVPYLLHNEIWDYLNDLACEPLGFNNISYEEIVISPNPAIDFISIQSLNTIRTVTIYNSNGQVVLEKESLQNNQIDIKSLDRGIYFIHIKSINDINTTQKLVKY